MKALRTLVVAAVASITMSTAALAADLYAVVTPTGPYVDEGHDWSGFYIGKLGGFSYGWDGECDCDANNTYFGISKVFGYNWDDGDVIYGIDKMLTVTFLGEDDYKLSIQKMGRIGFEISDNAMVYAGAGLGWATLLCDNCSGGWFYAGVAAGVEVAVADNLNWRTHVQYSKPLHPDLSWLNVISVGTGLVWQFN